VRLGWQPGSLCRPAEPANGRQDHIQLTKDGNCVIIRNTLGDWGKDTVDHLAVRRVSGPPPEPPPSNDVLERAIVTRLRDQLNPVINTLQAPILALPANVLPQPGKTGDKAGFLSTQRNSLGHFRIAKDEALIVTLQPGAIRYSTISVTNIRCVTPEYWRH
jgi:hypothetical protein